jgi:OmcA/MtrC family decaheme c-type cytochrome
MNNGQWKRWILAVLLLVPALILSGDSEIGYGALSKARYASREVVNFVRPGLTIKINSAEIAADGTISTVFTVTDPKGLPLDRNGVTTPGAVAVSFVAAYIPNGQEQYTAYTTRAASGAAVASTLQAGADANGTFTAIADGQYRYTFRTKAPSGYDKSATHTIGIYGSRNLTEFDLGTNYASTTFNFVPSGAAVTKVREVVKTASCNNCHDQLSAHGGSRRGVEMCVLCHTPQTVDADTGNSVDLKVMAHKIHMGSQLPSVKAGKPYQIIGFNSAVNDWSSVAYPANPARCETCHDQQSGAAQATAYLTRPTRVACGSCHDNVNFATGENHAGGPQVSDNQCSTCHVPQGELEFDASIKGGHTIPTQSSMLSGLAVELTKVSDGAAGKKPAVSLTVKDKSGASIPLAQLGTLNLVMAGPNGDYGYTSFGSDVTTPGYVSEDARQASCGQDGVCVYTFRHAIPADAKGSFSIGVEARRTEILLAGTTKQMSVQYGAINKVINFSVDGSPLQKRRTVVDTKNCNQCHSFLSVHGENRNQVEMCVLCHNPSQTDLARRPGALNADDKAMPAQGVNFNLLIHRIHSGENLKEDGKSFTVVGFGGSHNDFTEVRYPAMSPTGAPGDRRNCAMCHVNGSEQNLATTGLNKVTDPQGPINPITPFASACTGCHVTIPTASHTLTNTNILGESCATCHGANADFSVAKEHAQY